MISVAGPGLNREMRQCGIWGLKIIGRWPGPLIFTKLFVEVLSHSNFKPGFQRKPGYCNAEVGGGRVVVNFWFPLNNFSLLWFIDTKLAVWVAYIKRQLGMATQVSVINVKVIVNKIKIQFPLNYFRLLWPIDTILAVYVAYITRKLGIATQVSLIKVKVTVTKEEIQLPLNNFSLLWSIDTKLVIIKNNQLGLFLPLHKYV